MSSIQPRPSAVTERAQKWAMRRMALLRRTIAVAAMILAAPWAMAQGGPPSAPAVGVVTVERQPITEHTEFNGRIESPLRVDLVARVTAFLNERLFTAGAEVKKGDLLYRLERPPFEADLEAKQAAVAQAEAQLENANLALARAEELLRKSAGTQVAVENARAQQRSTSAQLRLAQAQLHQSQINLEYTEIRSPIDGRIGRTLVDIGNLVGPTTGTLATVVSQDPMYVTFPVPMPRALELRDRYEARGGFDAVRIRVRLPGGKTYDQVGKLNFVDISVAQDTDTIILRGTIPNPVLSPEQGGGRSVRELINAEFVTVSLEALEPRQVIAVPRAAILADQQGDYVFVVDENDVARQRRVRLGQSTPQMAAVIDGLKEGERVVVEGLQRVRPDMLVAPRPASAVARAELMP